MRKQNLGERVHYEACLSLELPLCTAERLWVDGWSWEVEGLWMLDVTTVN